MLATHSIHAPHRAAASSFRSLGKLPCSHTTPPEPYRAVFPAVRPRSDPDVANLYPVALAALAATLRTRRTSPDQSTFLHAPAIRQSHAEPPIPPCLPLTASMPRTGRRRVPSGRSESSLAVTPRRPNPIAPSSLRSGRALTPTLRTFTRSRSLRSQPPFALAGPLRTSPRSCMYQPSANPMPNLRSHHACHSQHPCPAPGGVEFLPVARKAPLQSHHAARTLSRRLPFGQTARPTAAPTSLRSLRTADSAITPPALRSGRALHPSPLQTCQRSARCGRRTSLDQVRLLRANFFPARQNPHPTTRRPQRTATGDPSTTSAEYGSLRLAAKDSP